MNDVMMSNEWDDFASGWDANDDVRVYAQKAFDSFTRKVAPLISDLSGSRVLDFGCGTGLLTERLAPVCDQIVAIDTSTRMIDVLRNKAINAGVHNITVLSISVDAATINECVEFTSKFDLIVASSVCSFLPDYEATLADLASLLKPGGYFVQWDWMEDMPVTRIRRAFEASGLVDYRIEEEFVMSAGDEPMPVVMAVGRLNA